jgi:hypothetical protein
VLKLANLEKFESRSSNGVFLGYALHSRAYRVLYLETNCIMETCEVTFDEAAPCPSFVFEPTGLDRMAQTIFVEVEQEDIYWGDPEPTLPAYPVKPTPLLWLMDLTPLLPSLGLRSSQCLLHVEAVWLLLRGVTSLREAP